MRTGEIIDLANERRLSAVLDFTPIGGELLILNGGSRAEELTVITIVNSPARVESRAAYCVDSGTSVQLYVPLTGMQTSDNVTLRIVGGHGEMLLAPPQPRRKGRFAGNVVRTWSTLAAAAILLILAGGPLDSPSVFASADPEPAAADAPLVHTGLSLHVPTRLPNVVAKAVAIHHQPALVEVPPVVPLRTAERKVALAPSVKPAVVPQTPGPQMTDLRVPTTAKSGDFVPVSFGAVARQVKIVASIGPTIVSKTIIGAQHGVISIRAPKSDLDSRVMTVRAYAENGNRTSTLQALVVLVRP